MKTTRIHYFQAALAVLFCLAFALGPYLTAAAQPAPGPYDVSVAFTSVAPNPAYIEQVVTVAVAVTATNPLAGVPVGVVEVQANLNQMCLIDLNASGAGSCTLAFHQPANVKLKAIYRGYAQFKPNVSPALVLQIQDKFHPVLSIDTHTPDPSIINRAVLVGIHLTSSGPAPTGLVTVYRGGTTCSAVDPATATDRCIVSLGGGSASCSLPLTASGRVNLCAAYAGATATYAVTSDPAAHIVSASNSITVITGINPSPSVLGQPAWVYFSVTSPDGIPTGMVTVTSGASTCQASVEDGRCQLTFQLPHLQQVVAAFAGSVNNDQIALQPGVSEPYIQRVNAPPTDIQLSPASVQAGQAAGSLVGNLTTSDPNPDESHTYNLVEGSGATHNSLFALQDDQLILRQTVSATRGSLSIRLRATDPAGLSFEKIFTLAVHASADLPSTGFAPARRTLLPAQPADQRYDRSAGLTLEIPEMGMNAEIVGVPAGGGSWDTTWLGSDLGWLAGTAFPTWVGNSVIAGHNTLSDGTPGPFAGLTTLRYGDEILVHAFGQTSVYAVRAVDWVRPNDPAPLRHEEKSWLTLVTCSGYDEAHDIYRFRFVVRAVLIEVR